MNGVTLHLQLAVIRLLIYGITSGDMIEPPTIDQCNVESIHNKWPIPFFPVYARPIIRQRSVHKINSTHSIIVMGNDGWLVNIHVAYTFFPSLHFSQWQQPISVVSYCDNRVIMPSYDLNFVSSR